MCSSDLRDTFTLVDEAEQDVLGADVGVVQQPRFFLRQHDHSSGPVGETFEHCYYRLFAIIWVAFVSESVPPPDRGHS